MRAVGQISGLPIGTIEDADLVEPIFGLLHGGDLGLAIAAPTHKAEHRIARRPHQLVVLGDDQVLQPRHLGEEAYVLEGSRNPGMLGNAKSFHPLQQKVTALVM